MPLSGSYLKLVIAKLKETLCNVVQLNTNGVKTDLSVILAEYNREGKSPILAESEFNETIFFLIS